MVAKGRADLPVDQADDKLGTKKYAAALADFVLECETPMTVGIQGEWGSGKTSLMRMMEAAIRSRTNTKPGADPPWLHTFETWQYGVLGETTNLGFELLLKLTAEITSRHMDSGVLARAGANLWRAVRFMSALGRAVTAGAVNQATMGIVDGGTLVSGEENPMAREPNLEDLKSKFAGLVSQVVSAASTKGRLHSPRFVLFVDDLDRVRPDRAVSMLEVLKNFMDVPGVVFVVACDYEVVRQGVKMRFGIEDEDKARAFFEKIIQVPFHMPVASYDVKGLLTEFLESRLLKAKGGSAKAEAAAKAEAGRYAEKLSPMVKIATGSNPRAFKRFLNAVDLHARLEMAVTSSPIDAKQGAADVWASKASIYALVGLVALQLRWPRVATYLVARNDSYKDIAEALKVLRGGLQDDELELADVELISAVKADIFAGKAEASRSRSEGPLHQQPGVQALASFIAHFWLLLDVNSHGNDLRASELESFIRLGKQISLTDVSGSETLVSPWYDFVDALESKKKPWATWAREEAEKLYNKKELYRPYIDMNRGAERFQINAKFNGKMSLLFSISVDGDLRHNLIEYSANRVRDEGLRRALSAGTTSLAAASASAGITWLPERITNVTLDIKQLPEDKLKIFEGIIEKTLALVAEHLRIEDDRLRRRIADPFVHVAGGEMIAEAPGDDRPEP